MPVIPRRSVLYMPASNARALEKARSLPADCIVMDLEDAVAPAMKISARQQALAAIRHGGYGSVEVAVRINAAGTVWFEDDIDAMVSSGAQAVVLPKVEDAATIVSVAEHLPDHMALWAMIETPRGVIHAESIACAHEKLQVLVMGTSDLAKELRVPARPDRAGLLYSLGRCVCAARMAGIDIIDGVHLDFGDSEGLVAVCEQGRGLGFDGKSLIHPGQIDEANRIFAPSAIEIERAEKILAAWQEAEASGAGVAVLDGKLVENLHVAEAGRLLQLAQVISRKSIG